ncbi:MAG: glucose 1-dehydrogenase [Alphaproteobacteria bacterium]|jgi:NAD(P)-dependent dehydrogenase (short-subunit alcohol dehydrogenase family)|nr:glucose 1-dehydrogenase [Alphaproteobacteria bacterium]MDP6812804.1 glucose 1-dehydrogenase [Alphaproteobacteria bacterium]
MTLRDKVVLVTGAGCGIGAAIALAMAREGARVVAADIDAAAAAAGARAAADAGAESLALTADVGDLAQINGMVADAVKAFGRLDVMVNNAGVTRQADIMDLSEADWDRIHRVNAKGLFFCLQRAARQMIDQGDGGCIINMASIAGRGYIGTSNAAYAASKGAVIALTKTAAQQLGRHDINVNAICPGVTLTPLVDGLLETRARERGIGRDEALDRAARPIPIGRLNEPADIAAMAVFLASPGARNITGQAFNVDGGLVPS